MGVIYDREHKFNGERGVLYGIVKKINNDILIKDFTNDLINNILYNINIWGKFIFYNGKPNQNTHLLK